MSTGSNGGFALDQNLQSQLPLMMLGSRLKPGPGQREPWGRDGGLLSPQHLHVSGGYLVTYLGTPQIGDVRVSLTGRWTEQATVAAQQTSFESSRANLGPYPSQSFGWFGKRTKPLEKLEPGMLSQDEFVKMWNGEISAQLWIIRLVAVVLMIISFELIFQPLSTAADLLRMLDYCTCCLGSLLSEAAQCVIHTVAAVVAICVVLVAVAVAWIVARPGFAIGLLIAAVCLTACMIAHARRKTSARRMGLVGGAVGLVESGMPTRPAPAMATRVQPSVTPRTVQMNVTCPRGVGQGELVSIYTPAGEQFQVTVPSGVSAGQVFAIQLPT
jgi:hypothetical protein